MKLWIYGISGAVVVAWVTWAVWIVRVLTRPRSVPVPVEPDVEEADRRRQALGAVTRLDAYRQIQGKRKQG